MALGVAGASLPRLGCSVLAAYERGLFEGVWSGDALGGLKDSLALLVTVARCDGPATSHTSSGTATTVGQMWGRYRHASHTDRDNFRRVPCRRDQRLFLSFSSV